MRKWLVALALAFSAWAPAALQAQTRAWAAPSFMAPIRDDDIGLYFIKPKDTDWGIAGTWRQSGGLNLGVRGEYVELDNFGGQVDSRWGIGADAKGFIGPMAPPLAAAWTAGLGALIGSGLSALSIPVGLSLGLRLASGDLVLTPYVHPRVSFMYTSFDQSVGGGSETRFLFDTDVGAELELSRQMILRLGGTFGDQPALGAGLGRRLGRF